jgi:putative peptide zinc metalloprotease protein
MNTTSPRYVFNDAIHMTPAQDSTSVPMALCELPVGDERSIKFVAPAELLDVLRLFDGSRSVAEVSAAWADRGSGTLYSVEKLERLIRAFCLPKGVLLDPSRPYNLPADASPRQYLHFRLPLLPNRLVRRLAGWLNPLFCEPVAMAACLVAVLAHLKFYFASSFVPDVVLAGGRDLSEAMLLTILAAVCHELGHATAFTRYGGRRTEIGFGLYLYIPVLYTDVSDAWKFSRLERVIVDVGGVYFQALFATVAIFLFFTTHAPVWSYAVSLITLTLSFSLNPFLRMDGYWFVADAFGIRNLRVQSALLLQYALRRLAGGVQPVPACFSVLTRPMKRMLGVYTLLSTGFFVFLITKVGRQALFVLAPEYPHFVRVIARQIASHPTDVVGMCSGIVEMCWKTMILAGCGLSGWRIIQGTYSYMADPLRGIVRTVQDRPARARTASKAGSTIL